MRISLNASVYKNFKREKVLTTLFGDVAKGFSACEIP